MSTDSVVYREVLRGRHFPRPSAAGPMSPALDDLSLQFVICMRHARHDGLDIGCGDGIATAAALARGAHVTAVDPDQRALLRLLARIPPHVYPRLKVRRARVEDLDFKFAHFSAVHASRVLHLLDPEVLQESLRKFFRWLYPEGRLFISTPTASEDTLESVHRLDEPVLRRELELAGFVIDEMTCESLPWDSDQQCCSAIAHCADPHSDRVTSR